MILTTEQQVGILGQASATDPNVKAIAGQMTEDFTAALATDAPYGARELTHVDVGNVGLEGVTAVCGGP